MINARQEMILKLIHLQHISSQEELQKALQKEGFPVAQATISRDIRQLKLIKKADENNQYYYQEPSFSLHIQELLSGNIQKIDYAGNTLVIKCNSGTAQAVCTKLDNLGMPEIVGTLAGDDTIFVLVRTPEQTEHLAQKLAEKFQNR